MRRWIASCLRQPVTTGRSPRPHAPLPSVGRPKVGEDQRRNPSNFRAMATEDCPRGGGGEIRLSRRDSQAYTVGARNV
jgi:hypothetical protein